MSPPRWRLLVDPPLPGARNMAIDEALLRTADRRPESFTSTLRFYQWDPPAVSIGFGQHAAEFDTASYRAQDYGFVRRLTGGGAIFHHRELTFSFVGSILSGNAPPDTDKLYTFLNLGLVAGLRLLNADVRQRGCEEACRDNSAAFCTVRTSPYDLVSSGHKLLGSAQRWTKRAVLEHGFLPLEPNPLTPEVLCLRQLLGREARFEEVKAALCEGFQQACGVQLVSGALSAQETQQVEHYTLQYRSDEWNYRR